MLKNLHDPIHDYGICLNDTRFQGWQYTRVSGSSDICKDAKKYMFYAAVENQFCEVTSTECFEDKFHFLQAFKTSKNMNFIFCKLKNLKKHEFHFLQA